MSFVEIVTRALAIIATSEGGEISPSGLMDAMRTCGIYNGIHQFVDVVTALEEAGEMLVVWNGNEARYIATIDLYAECV